MNEHLEKLHRLFGNDWPAHVVNRIVFLETRHRTGAEEREVMFLRQWANETIAAGIAFKQSSLEEH